MDHELACADPNHVLRVVRGLDHAVTMRATCALAGLTFTIEELRALPLIGASFV